MSNSTIYAKENELKIYGEEIRIKIQRLKKSLANQLQHHPFMNTSWNMLRFLKANKEHYKPTKKALSNALNLFDELKTNNLAKVQFEPIFHKNLHQRGFYH